MARLMFDRSESSSRSSVAAAVRAGDVARLLRSLCSSPYSTHFFPRPLFRSLGEPSSVVSGGTLISSSPSGPPVTNGPS
nr:TPA_asm: m118.7 sORF [Murid betaherpesvirus 1]DBA07898.1 TPA_asm: m118.7 sORF [Murid betaherpesvirus 1]